MNLLCDFKRSAILSGPAASFAEEFELDDKDPPVLEYQDIELVTDKRNAAIYF